jgi:hypothetical protein
MLRRAQQQEESPMPQAPRLRRTTKPPAASLRSVQHGQEEKQREEGQTHDAIC